MKDHPFTAATAKQDPGVQEGETDLAPCACDAIADPHLFSAATRVCLARKFATQNEIFPLERLPRSGPDHRSPAASTA